MARRLLAALLAGGASVFAFAPFDLFPLAFLGLGALAWLLGGVARWREGFALGFAWGFGAFAAIPGFIGLAFIILSAFNKNKD